MRANPLLREPLKPEHIKNRLLGHWGSDPGQSLIWVHLNRLIRKYDLDVIYISGPGHGAPATLANSYLEGHYSEIYPDKSRDEAGMLKFFRQFSFPGGIGSHCTPETPGSIHEGGELGYSISHAFGAAFDNPNLIVTVVVGDGESETGPLATSWHSNKFLNPIRDGAVLPVLHLNGYKIANPTILARIPHEELESLLTGYGYKPYFVEGNDPLVMHQQIAATLEQCVLEIRALQKQARSTGNATRPRWPMIVLRSPKGWTGPKEVDGHKVEDSWRAHQVPIDDPVKNPASLKIVEDWMHSYKPEELFDANGTSFRNCKPSLLPAIAASPRILTRMADCFAKTSNCPIFADYAFKASKSRRANMLRPTEILAVFLAEVMRRNMNSFRVFGPDETASNRLDGEFTRRRKKPGTPSSGRKMPTAANWIFPAASWKCSASIHLEGWFEGYVLTGRHGLFSTYEAFVHMIDSMFNQHAKWLEKSKNELDWRAPVPSLNLADHFVGLAAGSQRLHASGSRISGCRHQ